jgi:hypothetical protein
VVLLVSSSRVKAVKVFLENQKPSWLDKKRRITVSEILEEDLINISLDSNSVKLCRKDFQEYDDLQEEKKKKEMSEKTTKKFDKLVIGTNKEKKGNVIKGSSSSNPNTNPSASPSPSSSPNPNPSIMAIPVSQSLANKLVHNIHDIPSSELRELILCLG